MNRVRGGAQGYTITEALIFLGVSAMLAVSALLFVAGQQGRTEFSQSVREMELILQDVMNDVATGNFPTTGTISCHNVSGAPNFSGSPAPQGTNQDCILVGRIIQFTPSGVDTNYRIFSAAGIKGSIGSVTQTLAAANPRIVPGTAQTIRIPYGIQVASVSVPSGCNPYAIGFFTNFATYSGVNLNSGARNADVVPLCGVASGADDSQVNAQVATAGSVTPNPANGIQICLTNGGQRRGLITVGGSGRQFTTTSEIAGPGLC